ncbi:hypothetical protein HG535_0A03970 [Zygotorulaspora mrakii]|uniref:RING-type E3 ubiquitin transferase n=1 Tax=Zygotorulaspora mrakii TaxID=42260 RepID=A0A7H9AWE4_ZYGMR|nr:uncharacterized protein HG535_0A03970 [Zygotorulaspora mrakii]QLG70457.1 hypothetical protein HG535_0A03970 [Zygotorulaspora mrakii]
MTSGTDYVNSFAQWQPDDEMHHCLNCQAPFSFLVRKHHCRCCGGIFCASCADKFARYDKTRVKVVKRSEDEEEFPPFRTCQSCYDNLLHLKLLLTAWGRRMEPQVRVGRSDDSRPESSSRCDSLVTVLGMNEVSKDNNETEHTHEISGSDRGSVRRGRNEDERCCPICNVDLTKFEAEEDAQTHVQDCINRAVSIQQHKYGDDDETLSPSFQNRMLVYKIAEGDGDNHYQECPICFEEMLPGEKVGRLECLCVFHYKCIKGWFNKKLQKMKTKDVKYVGKNFCPLHDAVF